MDTEEIILIIVMSVILGGVLLGFFYWLFKLPVSYNENGNLMLKSNTQLKLF